MKKEVHPGFIALAVVIALAIVGFLYYSRTATPPPVEADTLGNPKKDAQLSGAADGPTGITPDVQMMQQRAQQGAAPSANK
jgi:hypothetical protein